jgi:hypothetical protein
MWENFKSFMGQPFKAEMSALDWFMFVGLLLVILILWTLVLNHLKEIA